MTSIQKNRFLVFLILVSSHFLFRRFVMNVANTIVSDWPLVMIAAWHNVFGVQRCFDVAFFINQSTILQVKHKA